MKSFGITIGKYTNPADFIIKLAQAPWLILPGLDTKKLSSQYDIQLRPRIQNEQDLREKRFFKTEADFDIIGATREVSKLIQFWAVYHRNLINLLRNPRTRYAILLNGTVVGLLMLAIYWQIGEYPNPKYDDPTLINNWIGLAFLFTNTLSYSSTIIVLLQMPL
jgi:hypothetical protein